MSSPENLYETEIAVVSDFIELECEHRTNDLRFIDGKLHQKIQITDYKNGTISHRWDLVEGQE